MPSTKTKSFRHKATRAKPRAGIATLGIRTSDTAQLIRLVRAGFPFNHLARFEKVSGLPRETMARFVSIPQRTLTRRQGEGRLQPDESDRVLRASRLFDMAVSLFGGDVAAARQWLQTPQPGLGGEAPLEVASTEVGAREVENLIGRLVHGVFT